MSELPNIDAAVTVELKSQNSELNYQVIQYKALAEALLTERDETRQALEETAAELQTVRQELASAKAQEPVPTITDL